MSDTPKLKRAKNELRARMREVRDAIDEPERRRLSAAIVDRALELPAISAAGTVTAFLSFGSEVSTERLIEQLAARGTRVGVPIVEGSEIAMAPYRPGDPLSDGAYGIPTPVTTDRIAPPEVDIVIAPGLAFDRRGFRLGYGGGFYDRFFRRLRRDAGRVGIAFGHQLVADVPHSASDLPVQLVVTDAEVIEPSSHAQ